MSRKGENIYKRKDGRWEGRYLKCSSDGRKRYGYVYASTYREVKARLQTAARYEEVPAPPQEEPLLLSDAAKRWEESIDRQVKESTLAKYRVIVAGHLLPALGDVRLDSMTHERIESFSLSLLRGDETTRPLAPRTVSDILSVLRSILRFAQRGGATVPSDGGSVRIRRPPTDIRVLTRREQELLCSRICDEDPTPRGAGILLSLFAGLRVGEICALRWEDIALNERLIHVRHTMQRIQSPDLEGPRTHVVITDPKSASSARTIPLPEDLVRLLERLPGEHRGYFLTGCEDVFVEPRVMQYYFRRTLERCGVDHANYHALRHTFATRCVELGFDVKSLSELLGHSTISMTMDRYVHPSLEHKRENMQRLSGLMNAL